MNAEDDQTTEGMELPAVLRELRKVRREVAGYNTRAEQLTEQHNGTYTAESFSEALEAERARIVAENSALLAENVATRFGLPDDLADLLRGTTREELTAQARKLARYVRHEAPEGDDEAFDPEEYAREMRRNRRTEAS